MSERPTDIPSPISRKQRSLFATARAARLRQPSAAISSHCGRRRYRSMIRHRHGGQGER
jgi:hypothetical protein